MTTALRSLLVMTVLTSACYQSPVPISTSAVPYDGSLVGTWQATGPDASDDRMSVLQFDNGYYYVEMPWDFGAADTTRLRARAYLSEIAGTTFVNVQDIQGQDRAYTFFKLERHADQSITLIPLKDMPKFTTPDALQSYLREHLSDRAIYDNATRFRKVATP